MSGPEDYGRKRRRARRDFWQAWREEMHRRREEHGGPGGPPWPHGPGGEPPFRQGPMHQAWRDFFHEYTGAWPEEHWAFGGRRFNPWHQGVDSFNPFVATLLSKGGGLLPLIVLHLLRESPRYGNELMDLINERTGGRWVANPGAIYPLVGELERRGFVAGEWEDPDKRTIRRYTLTEAGAQELSRLRGIVHPKLVEAVEVLAKLARGLSDEAGGSGADEGGLV